MRRLKPYRASLAGILLAAREAVMAPIRPYLRDIGVTEQQWRVLRVLADRGELDPSDLADAALLHAPSVSRILKELVDRKLVRRTIDTTDGRRSILTITDAGRALVDTTAVHTRALLDAFATKFGPERLVALERELVAFTGAIQSLALSRETEPNTEARGKPARRGKSFVPQDH